MKKTCGNCARFEQDNKFARRDRYYKEGQGRCLFYSINTYPNHPACLYFIKSKVKIT